MSPISSQSLKQQLEQILHLEGNDIQWLGFREVREKMTCRSARNGHPEMNSTQLSHGVMVEVLAQGQFGYATALSLDLEALRAATLKAKEQALCSALYKIFPFTDSVRPKNNLQYQSLVKQPLSGTSGKEISNLLVQISEKLKVSPKIIRAQAIALTSEVEVHLASSNGTDAHQSFSFITTDFEATAQDGPIVQKRTGAGMRGRSYQGGWEHLIDHRLWEKVRTTGEQAVELLSAPECPTGTLSLVLMPDQMMLQIHESIGHPLEIDRILGDERNYAGWSFVKLSDFGHLTYGAPCMNVTFDPTAQTEFASYAFDDNGTPSNKEYLIREGKLIRGLGGIESQARSQIAGVANARASSWNRPPIDRMANLNLEPGDATFQEIIESVEYGVFMESNRSWSIDDFRNKFQFGCEYGQLIKHGKLIQTVKNPNYRGITIPFWKNLRKVGNPSTYDTFGTPYCGKGEPNQAIRVGHASPICLFDSVEIFGGAS